MMKIAKKKLANPKKLTNQEKTLANPEMRRLSRNRVVLDGGGMA